MKNLNLLMGLGLVAVSSSTAQAQTIASLGFEEADSKYTTEWALTPGGKFGDWVNQQTVDEWTEQSDEDAHSGEYCFMMANGMKEDGNNGNTWERGIKVGNLQLKDNTPYRVTFWAKSDYQASNIKSSISIGREYFDNELISPSGASYNKTFKTDGSGEWQRFQYATFHTNKALLDAKAAERYTSDITLPDGTVIAQPGDPFPESYFVIINMYDNDETYSLDDITIEEGVSIAGVSFGPDVQAVRIDFGYPTNIAALAEAGNGFFSLDPSCVTVSCDGEILPVELVEGNPDGYLYAFLPADVILDPAKSLTVSFKTPEDCPIIYTTDQRPSADVESEMKVVSFENEIAVADYTIDAFSSAWSAPQFLSSVPENESFDLANDFGTVTLKYNKALSLDMVSASVAGAARSYEISDENISLSDDQCSIIINVPTLEKGDYTLYVYGVTNSFGVPEEFDADNEDQARMVSFSVGVNESLEETQIIYATDFDNEMTDGVPEGWVTYNEAGYHIYGFNDEARTQQFNYGWGGNPGGGGARLYAGFSGDFNKALYWGSRGTNEGYASFGEQVTDWMLADGSINPEMPEGVALYLTPQKYQVSFVMAAWKGAPKFRFTLESLDGIETFAKFTDFVASPNMNGATGAVKNALKCTQDFIIPDEGYYVMKFEAQDAQWQEYLLANVKVQTMPAKSAYYKGLLNTAKEEADLVLIECTDDSYFGTAYTALENEIAYAEKCIAEALLHQPSEVEAEIQKLKDLSEALKTRVEYINMFNDNIVAATEGVASIAGTKFENAPGIADIVATVNKYAETNPSTLDDPTLAEVAPQVKAAADQLVNLEGNTNTLTWGIYKAMQTYEKLGGDMTAAAYEAGVNAVSNDRAVAKAINAANKKLIYGILAENAEIPEDYVDYINYRNKEIDGEDIEGEYEWDVKGIELTGYVNNPKLYREYGNNDLPGWSLTSGASDHSLNIGWGGDAPTATKTVTDQFINIYGDADYHMSQVIEGLPAGIYTLKISTRTYRGNVEQNGEIVDVYYNGQNDSTGVWDKYIYANNGEVLATPYRGGSWGYGSDVNNTFVENITVGADGKLTIGAIEHYQSGKAFKNDATGTPTGSWEGTTMLDDVRLFLVAPLAGFDYSKTSITIDDITALIADYLQEGTTVTIDDITNLIKEYLSQE